MNLINKRIIFFDLDGTLHQQDMFRWFFYYLFKSLPINILILLPILPITCIIFFIKGYSSHWPISIMLWGITFGHSEVKLQNLKKRFAIWFRQYLKPFPVVNMRLEEYLHSQDTEVWIITGSPEIIVKEVYYNSNFLSKVHLIGSRISRKYGGWILTLRCLGDEKVTQLQKEIGSPLVLYSGYSDSIRDDSILNYCKYKWRVNKMGQIKQIN